MPDLNLHELANMPGYGAAQAAVRSAGFWDDTAVETGELRPWRIRLTGTMECSKVITVTACTEEEAHEMAYDQAQKPGFDWEIDGDPTSVWTETTR
jgi:hypothetical protein